MSACVESRGGISPPRAPRTVHEPLNSHGSRCSAVAIHKAPVGKERWIGSANPSQPGSRPFWPPRQPLELPACPADQVGVYATQSRMSSRPIEVSVVVDPALDARIVHLRQIVQGFVAAMVKCPPSDRLPDCLQRFRTDRRQKGDDVLTTVPARLLDPDPNSLLRRENSQARATPTRRAWPPES